MQLHVCCVCDALQSSREATNPILNQSVVEKLFPLLTMPARPLLRDLS